MTQYARPDADRTDGSWLNSSSNNTNLYSYVDETSVNDSDYIHSIDSSASADTVILDLSSVTDPENAANHTVFYRAKVAAGMMGGTPDLTIALFQGGSQIATKTDSGVTTSFSDDNLNLSTSEANAITDYGDLRIKFTRAAGGGAGGETATISWCFFSCDDAASSSSIVPIAMNTYRQMRGN